MNERFDRVRLIIWASSYGRAADCVFQVLAADHPTEEGKLVTVTIKSSVAGVSETKSSSTALNIPLCRSLTSSFSASLSYDTSFRHPLQSLAPNYC